jgi:hypothetical protein
MTGLSLVCGAIRAAIFQEPVQKRDNIRQSRLSHFSGYGRLSPKKELYS